MKNNKKLNSRYQEENEITMANNKSKATLMTKQMKKKQS